VTSSLDRRLLLVHAHPDDESIGTGATMAKYAAEGAHVTLVTCTLGELGEIIPPGLAALAADRDDQLGGYRIGELNAACQALGVTDHRFLGGLGRWRDSGMIGTPGNDDPRAFWQADMAEAATALAAVIREVRPQVIVTYDDDGFYGHPDHIQAHRVTWRAFQLAADPAVTIGPSASGPSASEAGASGPSASEAGASGPSASEAGASGPSASEAGAVLGGGCGPALPPWVVSKFYASTTPESFLDAEIGTLQAQRLPDGFIPPASAADLVYGVPDEQVTTEIDGSAYLDAKLAAMRAHATQITLDGVFFALSNNVAQLASGVEHYALLSGQRGPDGCDGREGDLFAGVDEWPVTQPVPDGATAGRAG
jgi:N-acetyl-1-D-myo-inositol-2-amino-2-deoxy-alpha-D-glucopyranoside deacetylase